MIQPAMQVARHLRISRCWPLGAIGMVALVAWVESTLIERGSRLATIWSEDWSSSARAALHEASNSEILVFGDSLAKSGVVPAVLAGSSGWNAYNLAVGGSPPAVAYYLLRKALESGIRPRWVVFEAFPHFLRNADPWFHAKLWPELLDPREIIDLAWSCRDAGLCLSLLASEFLPSYRRRGEAREAIQAELRGEANSNVIAIAIHRRNRRMNRGAIILSGSADREALREILPDLLQGDWRAQEIHAEYLRRFLALTRDYHIPVVLLIPPVRPDVAGEFKRLGIDLAYTRFVEMILAGHPHLRVLDARTASYPDDLFADPIHLNRQGAVALSRELAKTISSRERDTGPQWVRLAHPFENVEEMDIAIEDLAQSLAIARARASVRR